MHKIMQSLLLKSFLTFDLDQFLLYCNSHLACYASSLFALNKPRIFHIQKLNKVLIYIVFFFSYLIHHLQIQLCFLSA